MGEDPGELEWGRGGGARTAGRRQNWTPALWSLAHGGSVLSKASLTAKPLVVEQYLMRYFLKLYAP